MFTGLAAQNIQGTTLHSLFGLGFGTSLNRIRQISPAVLSTYRCQLIALRVAIIDEISFVGCNLLACIDERLRQLRGINKPFGGVTVLCFGDLMQLNSVHDGNVFEPANCDPYGNIIGSRWSLLTYFELTEIMRQREKSWCELLNRLRFAELTPEDIERPNFLVNRDVPRGTPWACRKLANERKHNEQVMLEQEGPKHSIVSVDKTKGEMSENKAVCDKLLAVAKDMTENLTCGLSSTLIVSVGLPYMVTKNVDKRMVW